MRGSRSTRASSPGNLLCTVAERPKDLIALRAWRAAKKGFTQKGSRSGGALCTLTVMIALYQLASILQQMYHNKLWDSNRTLPAECAPWTYRGRFLCPLDNSPRPEPSWFGPSCSSRNG